MSVVIKKAEDGRFICKVTARNGASILASCQSQDSAWRHAMEFMRGNE
jgi:uncharacterized protein YegP (UPF0339 family)